MKLFGSPPPLASQWLSPRDTGAILVFMNREGSSVAVFNNPLHEKALLPIQPGSILLQLAQPGTHCLLCYQRLSAPRGRLLPPPRSTQSVSNFRPQAPAAELPATTLGSPQNRRAEPRRRSFRGPWSLPLQGSEAWRPVTSALGRVRSRVEPRCPCTRPSQALGPGPQGEAGAPGREVTRHPRSHLGAPSASSAPQPWASPRRGAGREAGLRASSSHS